MRTLQEGNLLIVGNSIDLPLEIALYPQVVESLVLNGKIKSFSLIRISWPFIWPKCFRFAVKSFGRKLLHVSAFRDRNLPNPGRGGDSWNAVSALPTETCLPMTAPEFRACLHR